MENNQKLELFYKKIGENVKKLGIQRGFSQLKLTNAMGYDSIGHIAKAEIYKYGNTNLTFSEPFKN